MSRMKNTGLGTKKKVRPECPPPDDRPDIPEEVEAEVFHARIVVVRKPNDRLDGIYIVGKRPTGGNYVARMGWCDNVPITSELRKMLEIDECKDI